MKKIEIEKVIREIELAMYTADDCEKWCMQYALNAYRAMADGNHSEFSWLNTGIILKRLIDELPLTPITEENADWISVNKKEYEHDKLVSRMYHSRRLSSLFKEVLADGTVVYTDVSRASFFNVNKEDNECFGNWKIENWLNKKFPVKLPYYPSKRNEVIVYYEDIYDGEVCDDNCVGCRIKRVVRNGEDLLDKEEII